MKQFLQGTVEYEIEKSKQTGIKPRLLLHACCGPCTAGTLQNIAEYFDITVYFYNPNIMPKEEFSIRLDALKQVISHFDGVKLIVPEQSENDYLPIVKGMEDLPEGGARCIKCFELRLRNTAEYLAAHRDEYDFFTTTLTISPLKNASSINGIGNVIAHNLGVKYLASDFKKRDGYLYSVKLCKEWGIYRQHYCGCRL
ncbi:MAG: epoxyqueuosine reductase QueH [Clostridia bacterium]|nr:epoxyqueuosine reductase QueH [Clostridia bacterium]